MKIIRLVFLIWSPLLGLSLFADWNPVHYAPKPDEEIYGTWTNDKEYNLIGFQKTVISADGWKNYTNITDSVPMEEGTSQIESKWTDSDGNIWYKSFGIANGRGFKNAKVQSLTRISKSGTVLEVVARPALSKFDSDKYPTMIDPNDPNYAIYYRASN